MRSGELQLDVTWEDPLLEQPTLPSSKWMPDAMGLRKPELTGVRIRRVRRSWRRWLRQAGLGRAPARAGSSAIAGVRPASLERATIYFLMCSLIGTLVFLQMRVFPELHALRAAVSGRSPAPANPPPVELRCRPEIATLGARP